KGGVHAKVWFYRIPPSSSKGCSRRAGAVPNANSIMRVSLNDVKRERVKGDDRWTALILVGAQLSRFDHVAVNGYRLITAHLQNGFAIVQLNCADLRRDARFCQGNGTGRVAAQAV